MAGNRAGYGKAVTREMYRSITNPLSVQAQITQDAAFAAVQGLEQMVMQAVRTGTGFTLPQLGEFQLAVQPNGQRALILLQCPQMKEQLNGN